MSDHHVLIQPERGQPPAAVLNHLDQLAPALAGPAREDTEELPPAQARHGPIEIDVTAGVRERGDRRKRVRISAARGERCGRQLDRLDRRRRGLHEDHLVAERLRSLEIVGPPERNLDAEGELPCGASDCGPGGGPGPVSIPGGGITVGSRWKPRRSARAS